MLGGEGQEPEEDEVSSVGRSFDRYEMDGSLVADDEGRSGPGEESQVPGLDVVFDVQRVAEPDRKPAVGGVKGNPLGFFRQPEAPEKGENAPPVGVGGGRLPEPAEGPCVGTQDVGEFRPDVPGPAFQPFETLPVVITGDERGEDEREDSQDRRQGDAAPNDRTPTSLHSRSALISKIFQAVGGRPAAGGSGTR